MTFENSKRLYEHYLEIGRIEEADQLLKKYPNLKKNVKPVPKKEEVEKDLKSE